MGHGRSSAGWRRALGLVLVALALLTGAAGCGSEEIERSAQDVEARAQEVRERAREVRERARELRAEARRLRDRVRQAFDDLEKAVPSAGNRTVAPEVEQSSEMERFLTETIESVDRYWTRTFAAAGETEPRVAYSWVDPGERQRTACGIAADDNAAFYCSADDTIYFSERFATELYQGLRSDLPGQRAGYGRAVGDFGVAYVVAHEYAHNLQAELDLYTLRPRIGSAPFELQADCLAGVWGNSVYREGRYKDEDIQEAISTAQAVGDFDFTGADHHGTPQERQAAWELGFRSGTPADCSRFVPAV